MKRIVFEGYLHDMYPNGIEIEGDTPAECLSGLRLREGFQAEKGDRHTVFLPDFQSRDALYDKTEAGEILVVPIAVGAGGNGVLQVVIGAVLVVAGILIAPYFPTIGAGLIKAGVGFMIAGVVQMLMPQPKMQTSGQEEKSDYIAAGRNTVRVGTRIPILLGRRKVWGHFLSFNVTAGNKPAPTIPPGDEFGSGLIVDDTYDYSNPGGY